MNVSLLRPTDTDEIRAIGAVFLDCSLPPSSFHHTLTLFYLGVIERFMAMAPPDLMEACLLLLESPIADKEFALKHYSRERLDSREARLAWVEPDLEGFATLLTTTCVGAAGAPTPGSTVDESS